MHRIAVISDTHGMLRKEVLDYAGTCEAVLHAGDTGKREIIQKLKKVVLVYVWIVRF